MTDDPTGHPTLPGHTGLTGLTGLTTDTYRELLTTAPANAFDADTDEPDLRRLFTPASHRLALDPDVTLVRGARGTGKTVWYKVLNDPRMREIAAASYMMPRLREATVSSGHGTALAPDCYPGPSVIEHLLDSGVTPENLWAAIVLVALGVPEICAEREWLGKALWARQHPEAYDRALAEWDRKAAGERRTHLILFDGLKHLHSDRQVADTLVVGLLKVALQLRMRTRAIRAKIFIRPDMYASAARDFADASKLGANAAELSWSTENLYGLLFHQLGNAEGAAGAAFRAATGGWRGTDTGDTGGSGDMAAGEGGEAAGLVRFVAPVDLVADKRRQEEVFVAIAGRYMGNTHRAGYTYTWLPNHLQDSKGQVSPRSFLRAVTRAAEVTRDSHAAHPYALHREAIRQGVQAASQIRVQEVTEDIPWVAAAVEALHGEQVPIEEYHVLQRWKAERLAEALHRLSADGGKGSGPKDPDDLHGLIGQLDDLGVMSRRQATGKLDMPDVYRVAFGIGRYGGVRRHTHRAPSR